MKDSNKPRTLAAGLEMSDGFNGATYDAVAEVIKPFLHSNREAWALFHSAWRGFAFRYRAAQEYDSHFAQLVGKSVAPPIEDRFAQDHALYGFFSAALSGLECFFFACRCLGSMALSADFPLAESKDLRFRPENVSRAFCSHFPSELLSCELAGCLASKEFTQLSTMRNFLSHRGSPPRHPKYGGSPRIQSHLPGNPAELSSNWVFDWTVDASTTHTFYVWFEAVSERLLKAALKFCEKYLVSSPDKPISSHPD